MKGLKLKNKIQFPDCTEVRFVGWFFLNARSLCKRQNPSAKITNLLWFVFHENCSCFLKKTITKVSHELCEVSGCSNTKLNGTYKFIPNAGTDAQPQYQNEHKMKLYYLKEQRHWRLGQYVKSAYGVGFYYNNGDNLFQELKLASKVTINTAKGFFFLIISFFFFVVEKMYLLKNMLLDVEIFFSESCFVVENFSFSKNLIVSRKNIFKIFLLSKLFLKKFVSLSKMFLICFVWNFFLKVSKLYLKIVFLCWHFFWNNLFLGNFCFYSQKRTYSTQQ